jgi:hypothetical protein
VDPKPTSRYPYKKKKSTEMQRKLHDDADRNWSNVATARICRSHQKLKDANQSSPLEPSEEVGPAATWIWELGALEL